MRKMKRLSNMIVLLGFVALLYGWTQSWELGAYSSSNEMEGILREIRKYTFISLGVVMLLISYLVDRLIELIISKSDVR